MSSLPVCGGSVSGAGGGGGVEGDPVILQRCRLLELLPALLARELQRSSRLASQHALLITD